MPEESAEKIEKLEGLVDRTKIDLSHATFEEISAIERRRASLSGEEDLQDRPIIFDNCWLITERLGEGGMSVVYKARHLELNRIVAIKVLLPHLTTNTKNLQRFKQEAVTASALSHPNLIRVENFGVTPEGRTFIIMDFVEGMSLADVIAKEGKLDPVRAVFVFVQAANALQHAHERNVIHRDLKPSNIMLINMGDEGESVKIVDFGIAKLLLDDEDQVQHLTQTGEVFGSPLYMSPEQCRGEKLDLRSDIYSMGVLMYEALTGHAPVRGANAFETMHKQLSEIPAPIVDSKAPDSLLKRLNAVVMKALEKDPSARYQSMEELERDLNNALIGAEKDWKERAKALKKQYKKVGAKNKKTSKIVIASVCGLMSALAIFLGVREFIYDPVSSMFPEQDSLFAKQFNAKTKVRGENYSKLAEQLDVLVRRDQKIWDEIKARWNRGDRRSEDYDTVTNDLIPGRLEAMRTFQEDRNYLAAARVGRWVLEMYEMVSDVNSSEYVSVFKLQGENYLALGDLAESYKFYEKAYGTADRTLSSYGKVEALSDLLYMMMEINVHERHYRAAILQAEKLKMFYKELAKEHDPVALREVLALDAKVAEMERLSGSPRVIDDYKKVIRNWKAFIASSHGDNQLSYEEFLAKSRYGLGLAQAQAKQYDEATKNVAEAYEFFDKQGKDPNLTERVRVNYLALLRKTNPIAYALKSLGS
ncbi:MAG TPA: serine/threonine-protein kinase [Candidatus Melainabacteria bacterium]|nr:serine/threonine-protein kinase [Candidatus Melainabacteria bacterium]